MPFTTLDLSKQSGTSLPSTITSLDATVLSGNLPALNGSALTNIDGGKVLQVQSLTTTGSTSTNSTSFVQMGSFSLDITPSSSSSKILLIMQSPMGYQVTDSASFYTYLTLQRTIGGSTVNLGQGDGMQGMYIHTMSYNDFGVSNTLTKLDSPNTTSQCSYKVFAKVNHSSVQYTYKLTGETNFIAMEIGA